MKLWSKEALVLGGMYGVLDTPFSLLGFESISDILLLLFIGCAIMLCFNKIPKLISYTINHYTKISYYLMAFGVAQYFGIIFAFIPGAVYGYKAANAEYLGIDYSSTIPQYLYVVSYTYWVVLILSLGWATHKSFTKKK